MFLKRVLIFILFTTCLVANISYAQHDEIDPKNVKIEAIQEKFSLSYNFFEMPEWENHIAGVKKYVPLLKNKVEQGLFFASELELSARDGVYLFAKQTKYQESIEILMKELKFSNEWSYHLIGFLEINPMKPSLIDKRLRPERVSFDRYSQYVAEYFVNEAIGKNDFPKWFVTIFGAPLIATAKVTRVMSYIAGKGCTLLLNGQTKIISKITLGH